MATIDARNVKPCTGLPLTSQLKRTYARSASPNRLKRNPTKLAICSGSTVKPVIMFSACTSSFLYV